VIPFRNARQQKRSHDSECYWQFGKDLLKYNDWKGHCLSILFGVLEDQVSCLRLALCKRFLELVFKLPCLYLDGCLDTSLDRVEVVDLYRCMLLCSLPIELNTPPFDWVDVEASEEELGHRHPQCRITAAAARAEADGHQRDSNPALRGIKMDDHSWVGTLYGLWMDKPNSLLWTTDFEGWQSKQYQQFRLDMNGISPSTLLLFCSMGTVECPVHSDEDPFCFLCPKLMANTEGFNQRYITDLCRLWNTKEENGVQDGMMNLLCHDKTSVSWGNIPYVLYPHVEHLLEKTPAPAPGVHGGAVAIKPDPDGSGLQPDRFTLTSTIRLGDKKEQSVIVGDRRLQAFDVDFESIVLAYKNVFGLSFGAVYRLDGRVQDQPKSLLALGCLIKDVNTLCKGFRDPERVLPGLFRYLEKRISAVMQANSREPVSLSLLCMGRSVPESFLRVRLMFRFLLGETVFGIVDGICRLTALSYCWLGLLPEQGSAHGLNGSSRVLPVNANIGMLTSPSPVSLIMCGSKLHSMSGGVPISKESIKIVESYSSATQISLEKAQALSIQSVLLTILRQYQGGLPFDNVQYRELLQTVPREQMGFEESELFRADESSRMTAAQQAKWYGNRIRHFIYHTIGISQQTDIITGWKNVGGSSRDIGQKKDFVLKVDLMRVQATRPLIDVLVRFLLLVGIRREKQDSRFPQQYANEFLDWLTMFLEKNGKSWQEDGDDVRSSSTGVIQNPFHIFGIVENKLLEKEGEVKRLDDELSATDKLDELCLSDPNKRTDMVSFFGCWCCS